MSRQWRPSTLLKASAVIHAGAAAALLTSSGSGPLLVGGLSALLANHAALATAGLLPRCDWLGPVMTRLPSTAGNAVAITIDDGPDPDVTPRVLDLLDTHRARATFFVIGEQARRHPVLLREIAARGHGIENHSEHHPHNFSLRGPRGIRQEVLAGRQTIADLAGRDSRFFRAPAGLRNLFLDPLLAEHDLTLAAWTRRAYDTRCGDPDVVLDRLGRGLAARDILLLHDRHAARTKDGEPVILAVLPRLIERIHAAGWHTVTLAESACDD